MVVNLFQKIEVHESRYKNQAKITYRKTISSFNSKFSLVSIHLIF